MKFAKIFERDEHQVLVMTEYDDEEDVTKLKAIMEIEGMRTSVDFIYKGEDQVEQAQGAFEVFTEEMALNLLDDMIQQVEALIG